MRLPALLFLVFGASTVWGARQPPPAPFVRCDAQVTSLYCADLVAIPAWQHIAARLDLMPVLTPFGAAVTVDGQPRYVLTATIDGLPPATSLGPYAAYVAWATTVSMDREIRLGAVANGRTTLGELAMTQFRILITAEASATVTERRGRLILRATSPAARLLAHRDMMSPARPGLARDISESFAHAHDHAAAGDHSLAWRMPPMLGLPMMPGMAALKPSVAPFLPGAGVNPATIAAARPRTVVDLKPGDVLELDARLVRRTIGGRTFVMYGFNGEYPGPMIKVRQASTVTVKFTNRLDMPTTVHWHGIRLDNRFDGVPGVTQDPVPPGGTFIYTVRFHDPGVYWYHPHVREDIQQDLGLYGNILVAPADPAYYGAVNRDETLILDDFLLDEEGPLPYGREAPTHALMGRFGNVFLVNGEPDFSMTVTRGEVVRFYLTNVSNARLYNISFGGARMKVIGSDVGKFEREAWVTSIVLAPAERYIVDVQFTESGETTLVNAVQALNHMVGSFFAERHTLARVTVREGKVDVDHSASFATLRRNADVIDDIALYRPAFGRPVDRQLDLTLRVGPLAASVRGVLQGASVPQEWNDGMPMENWVTTGHDVVWALREPSTGRENMDVSWRFTQGDVAKIRFFNDPSSPHPMSHPIHLHGQRFLVLQRNGVTNDNLVWKDTFLVAAGETVDILLELSNPGKWMLHCHVAEHLGVGMMLVFQVDPRRP